MVYFDEITQFGDTCPFVKLLSSKSLVGVTSACEGSLSAANHSSRMTNCYITITIHYKHELQFTQNCLTGRAALSTFAELLAINLHALDQKRKKKSSVTVVRSS